MTVWVDANRLSYSATRPDHRAKHVQLSTSHVPSKDQVADEDLLIDMPKRSRSVRSGGDWKNHKTLHLWVASLLQRLRIMPLLPLHHSLKLQSSTLKQFVITSPLTSLLMISLPTYTRSLHSHMSLPSALLSKTDMTPTILLS